MHGAMLLISADRGFEPHRPHPEVDAYRQAADTRAQHHHVGAASATVLAASLAAERHCLEAANAFQRFLRNRNAWATSRETLDAMFRVTGLAINAIHSFVKWGYFLNEPGRTVPWKQIHALYLLAETDGYSQVPFVLHPAQPSYKPSVQSLYLRTLILEMLNTGNLTKVQI